MQDSAMAKIDRERYILIVDDDTFFSAVVKSRLSGLSGVNILTASNARAALEFADVHGRAIELIICDIHMPDFDGVEFLGELRERGKTYSVLIVSSADATTRNGTARLCVGYGMKLVGCLKKPVGEGFFELVEGALASERVAEYAQ